MFMIEIKNNQRKEKMCFIKNSSFISFIIQLDKVETAQNEAIQQYEIRKSVDT